MIIVDNIAEYETLSTTFVKITMNVKDVYAALCAAFLIKILYQKNGKSNWD